MINNDNKFQFNFKIKLFGVRVIKSYTEVLDPLYGCACVYLMNCYYSFNITATWGGTYGTRDLYFTYILVYLEKKERIQGIIILIVAIQKKQNHPYSWYKLGGSNICDLRYDI